jgi:hypothetical protein
MLGEADARYQRGRLELRGEFAQVGISNAAQLNETIGRGTGVPPNIARTLRGFYGEAGYRIWDAGAPRDLVTFVRYENIVGVGSNLAIPKRGHGYAVTRFTAGRPGRYTFECNRLCGAGHNFMRRVIIVRPAATGVAP